MLSTLLAWDANGDIVATLDHMVAKDEDGNVVGLLDFETHERAGGRLRDIWENSAAVGSGTWPEWLGPQAHDFRVELDANPAPARARIVALVHKASGHRRERGVIEAEIAARAEAARLEAARVGHPVAADLRDLLGGPDRPLLLDEAGRTRPRGARAPRPALPYVPAGTARSSPR